MSASPVARIVRRLRRGASVFAQGWRQHISVPLAAAADRIYRFFYGVGIATMRSFRRRGRRLARVLAPVGRALFRAADRVLLVRLRAVKAEFARLGAGFALVGTRARQAFSRGFFAGLAFVCSLPYLAVRRHGKAIRAVGNVLLPAAAAVALLVTVRYWSSLTFALELEYQGRSIGYIADETVFTAAADLVENKVVNTGDSFVLERVPKLTVAVVSKAEILDETSLCDRLMDAMGNSISAGAGLYINDDFVGAAEDSEQLSRLVTETLAARRDGSGEDFASFVDDVQLRDGLYPSASFLPLSTLEAYIGQLDVQVSRLIVYDESIAFSKKTVKDKTKYLGYSHVKTKGVNGTCRYTAQVVYLNGEQVSKTVLTSEITQEPVTQVTVIGAMTYNDSTVAGDGVATGRFIWPVPYTKNITSYFGARWGSTHYGIDISAGGVNGKPILAADGGKVIAVNTSGWGGGWGNYVLIDHGNGYKTRYAHCKSVVVKVGQKVAQGELIAYVGSTGDSTGPHLHFEVLLNEKRVNPLPYLQAK
ncbi:MAG: peptidoglycan DD-metalloendopeptidase family protein [Clostridia bacterium]|nr:peptidoglycan DD-metalloendopeptidase family protein [Clostridia bacterium]